MATDALAAPRQAARIDGLFLARTLGHIVVYAALLFWAFVCLFPIYWTVTTSFKSAVNVTHGHLVPWLDFVPDWRGWRALELSPDTIGQVSTAREEFVKRFTNSVVASLGASTLAIVLGSLAAYGLSRFSYRFGPMRNKDIFFLFRLAADSAAGGPGAAAAGALHRAGPA